MMAQCVMVTAAKPFDMRTLPDGNKNRLQVALWPLHTCAYTCTQNK